MTGVKIFSSSNLEELNEFLDAWIKKNPDKRIVSHQLQRWNRHEFVGDRLALSILYERVDFELR